MILNTSALVAVMLREPGSEWIMRQMAAANGKLAIGAASLAEAGIVLSARLGEDARGRIARVLDEVQIAVIPFTESHYAVAVDAWLRFGKGRHPAALNFGDCLSYATATIAAEALLCIGDDFANTDCLLAQEV